MMIKVTAIAPNFNRYSPEKKQVGYYEPTTPKEKIKNDFGIVLDKELEKCRFERVV